MKGNAFDELLASIDEGDREAISGLTTKYPSLKDGWMKGSDYSRKMDELRADVDYAKQQADYYQKNWIPDAFGPGKGAWKETVDHANRAKQLETQLAAANAGGDDVTLEQLNQQLDTRIKELGLPSAGEFAKAKDEFSQNLAAISNGAYVASAVMPTLAVKHFKDFNEVLDGEELFKFMADNKITDLKSGYSAMVKDRVAAVEKAKYEAELKAAEERGRQAALKETHMSSNGMPTDMSGPNMGHVQRMMMNAKDDKNGSVVPDDIKLGQGVGVHAARVYDQREAESRAS